MYGGFGDGAGDGCPDLAIGMAFEGISGEGAAGAVAILPGVGLGLQTVGNQLWHQDRPGIHDRCEAGDHFGAPPN